MLTPLDDAPFHQLPTTFDHVGPSDPRFFDRLWFAASDPSGGATLQVTMGVYQNMNVVDGGAVVVVGGRQHNLRVSRQLRPRYETTCGPLRIDVVEPLRHLSLGIGPNPGAVEGSLEWRATFPAQEERHHFGRRRGRVVEDYARYDQIGECSGWLTLGGTRVDLDRWWACRDHSWGVRERVGIPEPVTGEEVTPSGAVFAFLFFSTDVAGGHVQVAGGAERAQVTAAIAGRDGGPPVPGRAVALEVDFFDDRRPRRFRRARFSVTHDGGAVSELEAEARGPAVAMEGLGYGGYRDGRGLGVWRGGEHLEHDVWDVTDPVDVVAEDGRVQRPVHRIQPVTVTQSGPHGSATGTGSLTLIAETPLDPDGRLRLRSPS